MKQQCQSKYMYLDKFEENKSESFTGFQIFFDQQSYLIVCKCVFFNLKQTCWQLFKLKCTVVMLVYC